MSDSKNRLDYLLTSHHLLRSLYRRRIQIASAHSKTPHSANETIHIECIARNVLLHPSNSVNCIVTRGDTVYSLIDFPSS
ncbi:hypothetical protein [[Clostridium] innocuum]|uniref:hypothetical protein n=1 Tax=Clostridium innocuum TaxID=1522 RepID=UPI001FCB50D4|nr:hypothetical protein [[Clostridium] innocuum]MCR0408431.1 hypothetical protein [[Clostridium] innocuum]MCR0643165.1 hypothetical protein [[Clostridium] innocuum]